MRLIPHDGTQAMGDFRRYPGCRLRTPALARPVRLANGAGAARYPPSGRPIPELTIRCFTCGYQTTWIVAGSRLTQRRRGNVAM